MSSSPSLNILTLEFLNEDEALYLLAAGRSARRVANLDRHLSRSSGETAPTQARYKYVSAQGEPRGREKNSAEEVEDHGKT